MRGYARSIYVHFKRTGVAPQKWGQLDVVSAEFFFKSMVDRFPDLAFCENNWKANLIAISTYPSWWRNHGSKTEPRNEMPKRDRSPSDANRELQAPSKRTKSTRSTSDTAGGVGECCNVASYRRFRRARSAFAQHEGYFFFLSLPCKRIALHCWPPSRSTGTLERQRWRCHSRPLLPSTSAGKLKRQRPSHRQSFPSTRLTTLISVVPRSCFAPPRRVQELRCHPRSASLTCVASTHARKRTSGAAPVQCVHPRQCNASTIAHICTGPRVHRLESARFSTCTDIARFVNHFLRGCHPARRSTRSGLDLA